MPFETPDYPRRRIAIIGAGISGMGAAYHLADAHDVTLFEAAARLGGHARTIYAGQSGQQPVDTGFILFNFANYPHLTKLFADLDVPITPSDMSFAASINGGRFEYGLHNLRSLFAQPKNAANPKFLRMLRDIMRFNTKAQHLAQDTRLSMGEFLDDLKVGPWFKDYYLTPLSGAIWSTPKEQIMEFPAQAMIQFFRNHHLMQLSGQHQWWTVKGGSIEYVNRLEAALRKKGAHIMLSAPISTVRRSPQGVGVMQAGAWHYFDDVIFATHSDDSLALLADPTPDERAALGAVRYQPNEIILHADPRAMPKRKITWSSWNYTERPGYQGGPIDLTYWMNRLQPIPKNDPLFVTLNSRGPIDDKLIYDTNTFHHPVYDLPALAAQKTIAAMNGQNATWYCGAWMKNGFHEDGYGSALDVVAGLSAKYQAVLAA